MSARRDFIGDYLGFSFGYKADEKPMHSSDLGIVRTSNGSRFDENLLPTMQDKTVQVPGGDGTYYFGSYFTQRQFSIPFAFDGLTEEEFENLKRHFGDKKVHDLIFDEKPDRVYRAKVTGTATIKHIPFDVKGETIYKGEGTIQFTCYEPFARAAISSIGGLNKGDLPVPFKLIISGDDANKQVVVDKNTIDWSKLPAGTKAQLNTKTGVVLKLDENNEVTTELMNKYVTGNLTAKIPVGEAAPDGAVFTCLYY